MLLQLHSGSMREWPLPAGVLLLLTGWEVHRGV
jgi:hypothetical protein